LDTGIDQPGLIQNYKGVKLLGQIKSVVKKALGVKPKPVDIQGVDYSYSHPTTSGLQQSHKQFVIRYLSNDPAKNLSPLEEKILLEKNIDVVLNWEATATAALGGRAQGVLDARTAQVQATALGQPNAVIYFSVDFEPVASQRTAIVQYFQGVNSVIGLDRTGAYGGYDLIGWLFDDKVIKWGWQTLAWSYGKWDSRAVLRQYSVNDTVGGASVDLDEAVSTEYGQIKPAPKTTSKPKPAPKPAPKPTSHPAPKPEPPVVKPVSNPVRTTAKPTVVSLAQVAYGKKNKSIATVQSALGHFYSGKVDGIFGPLTESAIAQWQRENGAKGAAANGQLTAPELALLAKTHGFTAKP
jgi:peptidoglycan hydrolase-like protein with peptidoglycan-binding domain